MLAKLRRLSHLDHSLVAHLTLRPEQIEFVDPLNFVFEELRNSFRPDIEHPFSIVVHDEIVGFLVLREQTAMPEWAPPNAVTLHSFCVDRAHQGKGYGKDGVGLAARWISINRPSAKLLMLAVNIRNAAARAAYLKSGFRDTGATQLGQSGMQNILAHQIGLAASNDPVLALNCGG